MVACALSRDDALNHEAAHSAGFAVEWQCVEAKTSSVRKGSFMR
ncbi:MAG: hypothetical protein OJF55_000298 [Rhodanobacteraceae bacterium]|nr:MAG: hypothetical protein OJF55_000298 [Rhodanobacteraceae bacterium]